MDIVTSMTMIGAVGLYVGRRRSNRRDCHFRRRKDDGKVS